MPDLATVLSFDQNASPAAAPSTAAAGMTWNDPALAAKMQAIEAPPSGTAASVPAAVPAPAPVDRGYLANIGAGASEAATGLVGLPVDVTTAAINLGARALGLPPIQNPVGGSHWINQLFNPVPGANPESTTPVGEGEYLARAASRGATSMLLPGGIARGVAAGAEAAPAVQAIAAGGGGVGAVMGATGGVTGAVASQAVPDRFKPLADMLGNLVGGAAVGLGVAGAAGAGRLVGGTVDRVSAPLGIGPRETPTNPATGAPFADTETGAPVSATPSQMALAGQRIANAAEAPPADLAATIPPPNPELPGQATVGQTTGNLGLLNLERTLRGANRAPFIAAEAANNTARATALAGLAGPEESGAAASDFFLRRLREIEATPPAETGQAASAQAGVEGLPTVAPATAGSRMAGLIAQTQAPAVARSEEALTGAETAARGATEALGGAPETRVQDLGGNIQGALGTLDQAKADQVNHLADAVDPNGTAVADMAPVIMRAKAIQQAVEQRPNMKAPDGETAAILDLAAGHEPAAPFRDLRDLRTRITDELRVQRGDPAGRQNVARLSDLLSGVDEAMGTAVAKQAANDAQAVQSGALAPDQTVGARLASIAPAAGAGTATVPRTGATVYLPSGRQIGVRYGVVDADTLRTSHNDDLQPNPNYPAELQPRQRERAASAAQVQRIAGNLQPERLGASASAMEGAPIVGPDGVVESGNARVLGIRRALAADGPQAQAYRDFLTRQGFDTAGIRNPALVRQRTSELSPAERVRFTQEANAEQGLTLSAAERARIDAARLDDATMAAWRGGDVTAAANAPFVRAFVRNVIEPGQEGSFVTSGGQLSLEGAQRTRNALLQKAYGDPALLSAMAETGDETIKSFGGALVDAAGSMARLAQEVAAGRVGADLAIGKDLAEAAKVIAQARRGGVPIAEAVAQRDAFGGGVSSRAEELLRLAFGDSLRGRVSRSRLADIFEGYSRIAMEQSTQVRLLGENLTREQALAQAEAQSAKTGRATPQGAVAPANGAGIGEGGGRGGAETRGPGAGSPGAQAPGAGEATAGQAARTGRIAADQGVLPREPLTPNLTAEQVDRYAAMRRAHLERVQTYQEGPIGDVLRPGARKGELVMEASRVAPRLFNAGGTSAEDVQAFVRAVGGVTNSEAEAAFRPRAIDPNTGAVDPARLAELMAARREALANVQRYAGYSLRQAAGAEGTLNPMASQRWLSDHAAALDAFPELRAKFENAAALRQRLDDLRAERKALDAAHPLAGVATNADLATRYWRPGPRGAEAVQRYARDAGDTSEARQTLADLAASDLRDAAFRNGTWSQTAYDTWMRQHASALSELPDLATRLRTLGDAQRTVADLAARRQDAVKAYQNGAARHYLTRTGEAVDPQAAITSLMRSPTAPADARALMTATRSDAAAQAGVKRGVYDWLMNRVRASAEAGVSGERQLKMAALSKILDEPRISRVLDQVYTPAERTVLRGVAESMALEARAVNATAIRGSPGTAADLHALAAEQHSPSVLTQLAIAEIGGEMLQHAVTATGPWGLALRAASYVGTIGYNAMRAAGLRTVSDLAAQGLLQPELGRMLVQRAITTPKSPLLGQLARRIAVLGVSAGAAGLSDRRIAR